MSPLYLPDAPPALMSIRSAAVVFALIFGAAACGSTDAGPPASVEQLVSTIGCASSHIQIDADELRQGICETPQGRYTITTFVTEKGKRDWLDYAQMYGGIYLVGTRWAVIASPDLLETLRDRTGGQIEDLSSH
ncbi:hypothetical protein Aple_034500 [Acrocarpospora pleiomorpha]|uniref:Lipoprotein n=1 Tax=Acrocarpospora pleiomorpha TaxID=90975 RepID=A0A5M3XH07_9ACTN|nr:hypothetical protein [Acrocarpospora pleiomorpha]GES20554.1 hypothetical protein Aple_034500 [Acrocarpospora pleiomorpha]